MSTGERTADDRAAAIGALTATLNAGMAEDEAAAKAVHRDWPAAYNRRGDRPALNGWWTDGVTTRPISLLEGEHAARHDPARILREVWAKRDLIAAIVAEPHDWVAGDEFYSCSQAVDYAGLNHESREPGSACTDPDRAGKPCDCGRDARVERLLRILAGAYEEGGR